MRRGLLHVGAVGGTKVMICVLYKEVVDWEQAVQDGMMIWWFDSLNLSRDGY